MTAKITRDELKAKLDRGEPIVLLEALPEQYYRKAHLPSALLFPHDRVDELAPALLPDKATEIVVYCTNLPCQNSEIAAARLTEESIDRLLALLADAVNADRGLAWTVAHNVVHATASGEEYAAVAVELAWGSSSTAGRATRPPGRA